MSKYHVKNTVKKAEGTLNGINAIVSQDKMIHFYYGDDGINTTYEEYYKQRQEIY